MKLPDTTLLNGANNFLYLPCWITEDPTLKSFPFSLAVDSAVGFKEGFRPSRGLNFGLSHNFELFFFNKAEFTCVLR